jgi:hypothetical protein
MIEVLNNLAMSGGVLFVLIAGTSPAITSDAINRD